MRTLVLFALASVPVVAQPFTAGVKLGVPADAFLSTVESPNLGFNSYTNRYLVGGTAELRLPFGLGVEADAIYRHYSFQTNGTISPPGTTLATRGSTGAWEFPLLAKYRFPFKLARPYLVAGVAWDTLQGFWQTVTVVSSVPVRPPADLNQPVHNTVTGFVVGGGVEIKVPYVHVSPEVRYTRWGLQHFLSPNGGFTSNQNQAEVMLGITF